MLSALAGSVGAGGGASLSMPSSATSSLSDRSPINIAPVGVNLGAILQPVSQGSPENGGIGADYLRRYSGAFGSASAADVGKATNWPLLLAIPAALVAILMLVKKR